MNNEDKRFKQINRIATPIRVDENGQRIEESKVNQPVENTVKIKKTEVKKKKLKKETNYSYRYNLIFCILINS